MEKLHASREIQVFKQDEREDEHKIGNNKSAISALYTQTQRQNKSRIALSIFASLDAAPYHA
jgi:hypothetical protein